MNTAINLRERQPKGNIQIFQKALPEHIESPLYTIINVSNDNYRKSWQQPKCHYNKYNTSVKLVPLN
jgi:hypothetical protein